MKPSRPSSRSTRRRSARAPHDEPRYWFRAHLERLEDRCLLSGTPPTVTLATMANFGDDLTPQVTVTATDPLGLPNGTQVSIDVDLNNNGSFTDAGEQNYTVASLFNGGAVFNLAPALPAQSAAGPYLVQLRAHVTDSGGNTGFSATQPLRINTTLSDALLNYINTPPNTPGNPDPNYTFSLASTIPGAGFTEYVYNLHSQMWRSTADLTTPVWQHWLQVVVPTGTVGSTALLFIDSGSNSGSPPTTANSALANLAVLTHTVTVDLPTIPNEPLTFVGDPGSPRSEDSIISYTFNKYTTNINQPGNESWPALLPMVKSAVRAMDTVQAVAQGLDGGTAISHFVVTGYSKRGWTTWLTAAADSRVSGIIPGVFDALNLDEQMIHHHAFYQGNTNNTTDGFSNAIIDYVNFKMPENVETPQGEDLGEIVDPYKYLNNGHFNIPKLEINSAGDEFFVPDSAQYYFNDIPGTQNYLRYIPNVGHGLNSTDPANSTLTFYNAIINNLTLPQFSWTIQSDGSIRVQTVTAPTNVVMWQATNSSARDFRRGYTGISYTSSTLTDQGGGVYVASVPTPSTGATAFFVQLTFPSPLTGNPYIFTTQVKVVSNTALGAWPFSPQEVDLNGGAAAGTGLSTSWSPSTGAVNIADNIRATITDSAAANLTTVAAVLQNARPGDVLAANTSGTAITATFANNTLTLSGSDTVAHYQQVLRTILYNNTSGGPGVATELVEVVATDTTAVTSAEADATINIDVAAPVVTLDPPNANSTVSWSRSSATPVAIAPAGTLSDADTANLPVLAARLTNPQTGDVLAANTAGTNITASFDGTLLTLNGNDTAAHFQQVLRTITYNNTNPGGPPLASETVSVAASDGLLTSNIPLATINTPFSSSIVNRFLFYKGSPRFDGVGGPREPLPFSDDNAIATDKSAYLPGSAATTFANVSSYTLGINGLMVDVTGMHGTITAGDFTFKTGNNNSPSAWTTVAATATVTTRAAGSLGLPPGGPDRIEITFPDNAIQKTWLEVIFKGNDTLGGSDTNTGLAASNVWFWANALADDGTTPDDASAYRTATTDELDARNNSQTLIQNIPITNLQDYNRDGQVSATDQLASRNNPTTNIGGPHILNIGGGGPFAPDAAASAAPASASPSPAGGGGSAVLASGLSLASSLPSTLPPWLQGRLQNVLDAPAVVSLLRRLEEQNTSASRRILETLDQIADKHHLHDDVLDGILVDLGIG